MKILNKIAIIFLVLTLSVALFACGSDTTCTSHTDADQNGKCDTCNADVGSTPTPDASGIALIKDGKINFRIVRQANSGSGIMMLLNTLSQDVEKMGATLDIVDDRSADEGGIEVLIGDVTSRGEKYTYDKYSLGMEGYIIKIVDNKILINAGSQDQLVDAVEEFIKDILGIKSSTKTLSDVTMTSDKEVLKIQDDYRVTSIKINGVEINGYTIACDSYTLTHQTAATSLNKFLYENAGYYLPIVPLSEAGKSIIIEAVPAEDAGNDGFIVSTDDGGALRIKSAYANKFEEAFSSFFNHELRLASGDINFDSEYSYTYVTNTVFYDDFLHLSEGENDYPAIKAAHDFANQCGQTVKATKGKTYTIQKLGHTDESGHFKLLGTIDIKTNVDWSTAEIIIDDTCLEGLNDQSNKMIFRVASDYSSIALTKSEVAEMFPAGIDAASTTSLNWKYDFPALVVVTNSEHKNYIRYGGDANNGASQEELVIVDENGVIDSSANFLLDYEKVTGVSIYRTDVKPVTISGGTITTIASRIECKKNADGSFEHVYLQRGIQVARSNTTLYGIKHYIENELEVGPKDPDVKGVSYYGFLTARCASNVLFENCIFTAHRYYSICGTYDFTAHMTNNIYLKNCKQSNFYRVDESGNTVSSMKDNWYWGLGGTNYCKNMVYDGCELTRYDAHSGVHNGKIINSKVTAMTLIGGGDMLIENCDLEPTGDCIIVLRSDYGATWNGTITIRNCRVKNLNVNMNVFDMRWVRHDFGYTCHLPNLIVDGITFLNKITEVRIFKGTASGGYSTVLTEPNMAFPVLSNQTENKNIVAPPSFIKVINSNGNRYTIYDVSVFQNTEISGDIVKISS